MKTSFPVSLQLLVVLGAALLTAPMAASATATKRALLIGIDDYQAPQISDLQGCGNDVELMRSVLIDKFGMDPANVKVLKDAQATRRGIIEAVQEHLIAKAGPDDVVILHYSGHGSQMPDTSNDESDGFDETLVAHDSRTEGVFDISDDEINGLLKQLTEKTKKVTFIFDSCHSGSATRAGNTARMIAADHRPPPPPEPFAITTRGAGEGGSDIRLNGADYVLISGCLATELSNEALFDERRHGVMTWFLAHALRAAEDNTTYRSLMDDVGAEVSTRYASQHPQLEGQGIDLKVFGTDRINPWPYVLVDTVVGETLRLGGGKVYGLTEGSVLDVYPPDTVDLQSAEPVAQIEVTEVDDFSAAAVIRNGGPVVARAKARLEAVHLGNASVPLYLPASGGESVRKIRQALEPFQALRLVDSERDARFILSVDGARLSVRGGDLEPAAPPVSLDDPDHVRKVVQQIKDLTHWARVMDLKSPTAAIRIGFDIRRAEDPADAPAPSDITPGTRLTYRVENRDSVPLFIYVLDVASDGSIALLYPDVSGAQEELAKGKVLERTLEAFLPEGQPAIVDVLKVIATTRPIDPSVFPQGPLRSAPPLTGTRAPTDPLAQFLADALRGTRTLKNVEVKSWVTEQRSFTVRDPGVRFSGFALHFDKPDPTRALPPQFGQSRNMCPEDGAAASADCFRTVRVADDGTEWELLQDKATRGDRDPVVSVGQAFDEAYRIQETTPGTVRVEPLLETQTPGSVDQRGMPTRDVGSDDDHDENASGDDQWHVKQIRAEDAWAKVRNRTGAAEGAEGAGLLIAHIDTGYREHPETWQEVGGRRPVDPSLGYDYFDGDADPMDPLLDDRGLDNPGHGTASGSVIVSPPGCQLENAPGCVTGIARGAQLVPLRVHRTVSQFNTANLTRAIRDVAEGRVAGQPKLISIAMGGPPTLSMWKAVKKAEQNGVLVVAAAGNYVGIVVWPARFRSTIAVAASNVRCQPWAHSSRGSKVDISSPGESVWRASLDKTHKYFNGMGKGTTFATGNAAGAAGLWLTYHQRDAALAKLQRQGGVTQAFRKAVQESSWKPTDEGLPPGAQCADDSWDADQYGTGILNVSELLDWKLSAAPTRAVAQDAELPDLPLFSSLYPDGTPPEKIRADYRSLFGATREADQATLDRFETEVLYHYTENPAVARSIEGLVEGQRGIEPFARVRRALLEQDLSARLRAALAE